MSFFIFSPVIFNSAYTYNGKELHGPFSTIEHQKASFYHDIPVAVILPHYFLIEICSQVTVCDEFCTAEPVSFGIHGICGNQAVRLHVVYHNPLTLPRIKDYVIIPDIVFLKEPQSMRFFVCTSCR